MNDVLEKHPDCTIDTIKKIARMNMSVAKESAALLIV